MKPLQVPEENVGKLLDNLKIGILPNLDSKSKRSKYKN